MKRILVVNINWLGDAVMTTPVFKALKLKYPGSYIGVMVVARLRDVFEDNPFIDEVIEFDEKTSQKTFGSKIKFISFLKSKKFDTVFLIHRSFTRALICKLSGIKEVIGYRRPKNVFVLTKQIEPPKGQMHRQDYYLYLFEKSGIEVVDRKPNVYLTDLVKSRSIARLGVLGKSYHYLVGVHVSANWKLKRWPIENFASVCDQLSRELNSAIIFFGSQAEKELVAKTLLKMKERAFNFCGSTTLGELAGYISFLQLFISVDSGPAHLSASLNIPTLVLFGPTSPAITSPCGKSVYIVRKEVDCQIPCYKKDCQDNYCMKDIKPCEVAEQAKQILSQSASEAPRK